MKPIKILITGIAMMALFAGCGKHNDGGGSGTATPPPTTQTDSFISSIKGTIANAPDDTEPIDIDSVTSSAPEDNEPEDL